MGCWDVFCFLCGNTCHSVLTNSIDVFLENVEFYEETSSKKNKWFMTYFKPIYEKYNKNKKLFIKNLNDLKKNTKWLNKCSFLTADNRVIHGCKEINCNINFIDKNNNEYTHGTDFEFHNSMYGVFVHTDCWKCIKNEYGIKLSYSHLPIINKNTESNKIIETLNYGPIEKYWSQDFDFVKIVADSNQELCSSPLKSDLVKKQIKKIFIQLKIKDDRPSPSTSATLYKNNMYKVGTNNNIWYIKSGKWNELKDTITYKFTSKNEYVFKKFIFIADTNDIPLFIKKYNSTKKNTEYEILTTSEYLEKISKKLI